MRGEGKVLRAIAKAAEGSSPHARGGPARARPPHGRPGLIPACAGRARAQQTQCRLSAAHPRMRGEGPVERLARIVRSGSSPHARGGPLVSPLSGGVPRLIPACAGRASHAEHAGECRSAHPRMRGEGPSAHDLNSRASGSSPHARGGLRDGVGGAHDQGLIPACAGRACSAPCVPRRGRAHPRMRGEGSTRTPRSSPPFGSSPHARGGPLRPSNSCVPVLAHPRMRGEGSS